MSRLANIMQPVRNSGNGGRWARAIARVTCLAVLAAVAVGGIGVQRVEAQPPAITQVGGFNVQFWNMGDNMGSGVFIPTGNPPLMIPDANLGTFTAGQQAAITRALQYWTDVLNLPAAGANSPVIRFAMDVTQPFNAFAASQGVAVGGGLAESNTYNRLVTGGNPLRADMTSGVDAAIVFQPSTFGFDPAVMTNQSNPLNMETIAIHEIAHLLGMADGVPIYDGADNFTGALFTAPWNANVTDITAFNSTFNGANAQALFGGPVPVQNPDTHLLVDFANLTRATPFFKDFRNHPAMMPIELAVFADLGYAGINFADHWGFATYVDGNGMAMATGGFAPTADYANGIFLQADNHNLLVNANVTADGFAATGIRLNGGQESLVFQGNTVNIAPGTTVQANGAFGIGVQQGAGAGTVLVHRGTINATGIGGRGVVFDFGPNVFPSSFGSDITSGDYGAPMVDRFDITGTINSPGGVGTAIELGTTAAIGEINIMSGATIGGNIVTNALVTADLARPMITFGKTADVNGNSTLVPDAGFFMNYTMNINGFTRSDIDLFGGHTRFNGFVFSDNFLIRSDATLSGNGTIDTMSGVTHLGTIAPGNSIGTLNIVGNLNSSGATFDIEADPSMNPIPGVHNDLIDVTGTAIIDGGTVNVIASPGQYDIGTRYDFITADGGVVVLNRANMFDNIPGRRVAQFATPTTFGFVIARDGVNSTLGVTFNQIAFGTHLDAIGGANVVDFQNVLDWIDSNTNTQEILNAWDQSVGDIHGTTSHITLTNTNQMYWLLSQEMHSACCGCDGICDGFIIGYGRGGEVDHDGNAAGVDYTMGGTVFGISRCLGGPRVGLFGNYANPQVHSMLPYVRADIQNYSLGTFLDGHDDIGKFLVAGNVGYDEYDVTRRIQFGPFDRVAWGAYDGYQSSMYLEHDVDMSHVWPGVRPVASLQYTNIFMDNFEETGAGGLNLAVDERRTDSLRSYLGLLCRTEYEIPFGWVMATQTQIGWQHEFEDNVNLYGAGLAAGGPARYTARGVDMGRNWGMFGLGLELIRGHNWSIFGGYDMFANSRQMLHTGTGSVSLAW